MKLSDGKKKVSIKMYLYEHNRFSPDCSQDFFEAGSLPYNEDEDVHLVADVDYCIEQAQDWKHFRGDYSDVPPWEEKECRKVIVHDLKNAS